MNDIFAACCENNLSSIEIEWHEEKSLCVVLCSKGYPDKYENNVLIENIEKIHSEKKEYIYHAGTKNNLKKIYSNGGRVLNFVVLSDNFKFSRERAIRLIEKLSWSNGFYRKDIGFRVIE